MLLLGLGFNEGEIWPNEGVGMPIVGAPRSTGAVVMSVSSLGPRHDRHNCVVIAPTAEATRSLIRSADHVGVISRKA